MERVPDILCTSYPIFVNILVEQLFSLEWTDHYERNTFDVFYLFFQNDTEIFLEFSNLNIFAS
jgi:hypothetical protein